MFSWILSVSLVLSFGFSGLAKAATLTEDEKMSDFHQLIGMIKSGYGPIKYKQTQLGIDIDKLSAIRRKN
jgi:hypothetical protein